MFARQWFDRDSQQGLQQHWLNYEYYLQTRQIEACLRLLNIASASPSLGQPAYVQRQSKRLRHIQEKKHRSTITIFFHSFWPSFSYESSIFPSLFDDALKLILRDDMRIEITDRPEFCDIAISSCFPSSSDHINDSLTHATSVLYLGENVRPSYANYDYSFTSDRETYCGRNGYLPVVLASLYEVIRVYPHHGRCLRDLYYSLYQKYFVCNLSWDNRRNDVVFIGNNYEPKRAATISQLRSMGIICDEYGSHLKPVGDKAVLYGQYKFVLCPENSFHPGYVTEKLLHGIFSDSRLIHWGYIPDRVVNALGNRLIDLDKIGISSAYNEIKRSCPPKSSLHSLLDETFDFLGEAYAGCLQTMARILSLYV